MSAPRRRYVALFSAEHRSYHRARPSVEFSSGSLRAIAVAARFARATTFAASFRIVVGTRLAQIDRPSVFVWSRPARRVRTRQRRLMADLRVEVGTDWTSADRRTPQLTDGPLRKSHQGLPGLREGSSSGRDPTFGRPASARVRTFGAPEPTLLPAVHRDPGAVNPHLAMLAALRIHHRGVNGTPRGWSSIAFACDIRIAREGRFPAGVGRVG